MNQSEYARKYSATAVNFNHVVSCDVPADVERRDDPWPCSYCGTRAGLPCKHRRLAA